MTIREAIRAFINQREYKSLSIILIASGSLYGAFYALSATI